jgi:hypothetical protein
MSVLCHATMKMEDLPTMPRNNANMFVAISMVTQAVVQHYYVCNDAHVEKVSRVMSLVLDITESGHTRDTLCQ